MDGDQMTDMPAEALSPDQTRRVRDIDRTAARRPKTVRWFIIVGIAAGGGAGRPLWLQPVSRAGDREFLRQQQAAAGADQRGRGPRPRRCRASPPASARLLRCIRSRSPRKSAAGSPRSSSSRAPRSRPATRWFSSTTPPNRAISQITRRRRAGRQISLQRAQTLAQEPLRAARERRPEPEPARPGAGADHEDRGDHRAKADPRAVCRPARRAADRARAIPDPGRADRDPDRPVDALRQLHAAGATMRPEIMVGQTVDVTADAFPGRTFTAEITTIEPQISADTRTMMFRRR